MKNYTHNRLLSECFKMLWNEYPETRYTCFHVTNELIKHEAETQKQHIIRLSMAKACGVVPGVLDLIWYWRGVMYAFDVKVGSDKLSAEQKLFISSIEAQGGDCYEIRSLEQFKEIVGAILKK